MRSLLSEVLFSVWSKLLQFLIASVLADVHYWSHGMLKNANETVAVNKNVRVQIVPCKQKKPSMEEAATDVEQTN